MPRSCSIEYLLFGTNFSEIVGVTPFRLTTRKRQGLSMSGFKEPGFLERQKAAQEARQKILSKFRGQPGPDDPAVKARQAEREAQSARRAKASVARDAAKADRKRLEAEAEAANAARLLREKQEAAARQTALEAEQKAARDARYAARKKKKK